MAELAPHEEKKQIKDLVNNTKLKEGQEWFVVDFKWWQLWKAYVGYEDTTGSNGGDGPRPGPITNTDLLDAAEVAGTESNRLRPGLVEEYDYVVIPKEAWIKLESWYASSSSRVEHLAVCHAWFHYFILFFAPKSQTNQEPHCSTLSSYMSLTVPMAVKVWRRTQGHATSGDRGDGSEVPRGPISHRACLGQEWLGRHILAWCTSSHLVAKHERQSQ